MTFCASRVRSKPSACQQLALATKHRVHVFGDGKAVFVILRPETDAGSEQVRVVDGQGIPDFPTKEKWGGLVPADFDDARASFAHGTLGP